MCERPLTRSTTRCVLVLMVLSLAAGSAQAAFVLTGTIPLGSPENHHGIAFDGSQWHIANPFSNSFQNYNASFSFLGVTTVAGVTDMRGLTYDPGTGTLFVGDTPGVVRQVNLDGTIVSMFSGAAGLGLNALAHDSVTDTVWLAYFTGGLIENRTKTGILLSSFTAPFQWTGLAIDPSNRTLLALEDNDTVLEYRLDGTLVGAAIGVDLYANNLQGLAYDPATGALYATSQIPGLVNVFSDPTRVVPEPSTALLYGIGMIGMARINRRREESGKKAFVVRPLQQTGHATEAIARHKVKPA